MAIEAERLYVTVGARVDDAEDGLERVERQANETGAAVRKAGKDAKAGGADFDSAGKRIGRSMSGADAAQRQVARSTAALRTGQRSLSLDMDMTARSAKREADGINQLSGRLKLAAQAIAVLGPGAVAMSAMTMPALAGIASTGGLVAVAGGVMAASFQGVGESLKAVNKAGLEPTEANITAARIAMERIHPEARKFVRELSQSGPLLKSLRDDGAREMFPGLTAGYKAVLTQAPRFSRIMSATGAEVGALGQEIGESLASKRWSPFLDFLAVETPKGTRTFVTAAGNVGHALTNLWMATSPQNDDFSAWLVKRTGQLDKWSAKVATSDGYAKFAAYTAKVGPQVEATLGATADALLEIGEAMAPLGGPVLRGLEGVATIIGKLADSDLGTPIFGGLAALTLYNRALAVTARLQSSAFMTKHGPGAAGGAAGGGVIAQQTKALQTLPAAYRAARTAQADLTKAQSVANRTTGTYLGQLQAVNLAQSKGARITMPALARLNDGLSKVEMANYDVREATAKHAAAETNRRAALGRTAATAGKAGAAVGALALLTTGAGESSGFANTATLALAGSMAGPWGAAIGAGAGLALDFAKSNDHIADAITRANQAMKAGDYRGMVAGYDAMTAASAEWQKGMDPTHNPFDLSVYKARMSAVWSYLDGTREKAKAMQKDVQGAMAGMGAATAAGGLLKSLGLTTGAMDQTKASLIAARQEAGQVGAAFVGMGADVNNAKVSLSGWLGQLEAQNVALSRFADNALKAGQRGLRDGLIKELKALGPEGALRMGQLANGTDAALNRANMAWVRSRQNIDKYKDSVNQATTGVVGKVNMFSGALNRLPKAAVTEIKANGLERTQAAVVGLTARYNLTPRQISTLIREQGGTPTKAMIDRILAAARTLDGTNPSSNITAKDNASGVIRGVSAALRGIPPFVSSTIVVNTLRRTTFSVGGQRAVADGGTITRLPLGLDSGGTVPGSRFPYGDKVLTHLAPGEEVITNRHGQADQFRKDRAAGRIPAYQALANGGTAGKGRDPKVGAGYVRQLAESIRKGSIAGIQRAANVMSRRLGGAMERTWDKRLKGMMGKVRERAGIAGKITAATATRDDLVQKRDSARSTIRDAISGQANVLNAGNNVGTIRDSLATQLGKVREFGADLQKLRSMGYGSAILEQVASAGIEGGAEVAKALLAGSTTDVASINSSFAGITSSAASTANTLASQMYDAGINTANGLIRGLQARRAYLDRYMKSMGNRMEAQLKRALGIRSPSTKFRAIGRYTADGAILGVGDRNKAMLRATRGLARSAVQGFGDPQAQPRPIRGLTAPSRTLTPAAVSGSQPGSTLHLEFKTYNPVAEPQSVTTNKGLARVGAIGLVPR